MYVETTSAVELPNGMAIFGSPTFEWKSPAVFADSSQPKEDYSGVLARNDSVNAKIPLPPGVKYMLEPLAARVEPGRAHVFWGISPAATRSYSNPVNGILYARFDGVKWSEPEQIVTATHITWDHTARSLFASDSGIDLVAPGYATIEGKVRLGIVRVRIVGGHATATWDHLDAFVAYTAIARRQNGAGVIALIAVLPKPDGERTYGVFAKPLTQSGPEAPPALIHALPPDTLGYWITAVRTRDVLHLLWVQVARGQSQGATIMHVSSPDGGRSWMSHEPLTIPEGTDILQVAEVSGKILVVLRDPATRLLAWTYWDGSHWGVMRRPFNEWSISIPAFLETGGDSVRMTWGVGITGAIPRMPTFPAPAQRIAVFRGQCLDRH